MAHQNERLIGSAVLALGIFIGLNSHIATHTLSPFALPALFLVAMFSLVSLATYDFSQMFQISPVMWLIVIWQQLFLPVLVLFFGQLAHIDDRILLFILITATAGSLFAAPAIVGLLRLDNLRAVQGVVLSTLFTPFSLYIFLTIKREAHADIDLMLFLERICLFLVVPACFIYFYKVASVRVSSVFRFRFEFCSRWIALGALVAFGVAIMEPVNHALKHDPSQVLSYLMIATATGLAMFGLTVCVFRRFGVLQSRTAGILIGFRNIGLSYGLIGDMVGDDFLIYVGIAMVPTYVIPFIMNIVSVRVEEKVSANRPYSNT